MKHLLTLATFVVSVANMAWAYSGSVVAPTGQTIYYDFIDTACIITRPGNNIDNPWNNFTQPIGALTIPDSIVHGGTAYPVTRIAWYAFAGCSGLTSVTFPEGIVSIGGNSFRNCDGLTSISIPDGVLGIGEYAFYDCDALDLVDMGSGVVSIGEWAFSNCISLTSIVIPDGVTYIRDHTFRGCSGLTSVTMGNAVATIGNCAFMSCSFLQSITIPNSVTTIGGQAFYGCSRMDSLTIGGGVTNIGPSAFYLCNSLTSIVIPDGVTNIAASTFWGCSNLTSVTLPRGVLSIGNAAFMNCLSLQNFIIKTNLPPACGSNTFTDVPSTCVLTVPCGTLSNYVGVAPWSTTFPTKVEYCPEVYSVGVLSDNSSMGIATTNVGTEAEVEEDETVLLFAISKRGYYFDRWSNGSTRNPDTLTITSDTILTAYFANESGVPCDTVYIHDTIYVMQEGVDVAQIQAIKIYVEGGRIVVENAENMELKIYTVSGCLLATRRGTQHSLRFAVPTSGVYLVEVGGYAARKVVVAG